jgi:hypothetical protein
LGVQWCLYSSYHMIKANTLSGGMILFIIGFVVTINIR